jgi:hypothetical protein
MDPQDYQRLISRMTAHSGSHTALGSYGICRLPVA